jgi:hypothetical protein
VTDGAYQANLSLASGKTVHIRGTVGSIRLSLDLFELAYGCNPLFDDVVRQKAPVALNSCISERHQLNEAYLKGIVNGQTGEIQYFVVIESLYGDNVDLDWRESHLMRLCDSGEH